VVETALVADIGGTHARFALADLSHGTPHVLDSTILKFKAADYPTLDAAILAYSAAQGCVLPKRAALAVATAVASDEIRFTNSPWVFKRSILQQSLGFEHLAVINDFGAVARAMAHVQHDDLLCLTSPAQSLPGSGVISVIGAGTGLGVAAVLRSNGQAHVLETEGGHIGFSPSDALEVKILDHARQRYARVSAERLISGPGLQLIYQALASLANQPIVPVDDQTLWRTAIDGSDALARAALERFCHMFGTVAGDIALVHGAKAVVIAGGLVPRFFDILKQSAFLTCFCAKGRFEVLMQSVPVYVCLHPDPGLLGAASVLMTD
jgi:glucokinase